MEFLVSEGMSEGTWPFSLKIFDKKISPISTSVECTRYNVQMTGKSLHAQTKIFVQREFSCQNCHINSSPFYSKS